MKLYNSTAEIYVPDGVEAEVALARTTHMAIGAHQDDIEIMSYAAIAECYGRRDLWFTGVTCTDGAGSPRAGLYGDYTDEQMQAVRRVEQKRAAYIGDYSAQILLDYPSSAAKKGDAHLTEDLKAILLETRPVRVYTHNLADKHDTHVATALRVIEALRAVSSDYRPERLYGCEVWRDLDWVVGDARVLFDVSAHANLAAALLGVFDSQISGGKRYDLATMGRRRANATYAESHEVDECEYASLAMDLTCLLDDPGLSPADLMAQRIRQFEEDVVERIRALTP